MAVQLPVVGPAKRDRELIAAGWGENQFDKDFRGDDGSNPLHSRLIGEFAKATSLPMLISTSLKINEQPTVKAPLEALHIHFCRGLDVLYLGPYRLQGELSCAVDSL